MGQGMNFYTDDSPGIKIQPVSGRPRGPDRSRTRSSTRVVGLAHTRARALLLRAACCATCFAAVAAVANANLSPWPHHEHTHTQQVWVIVMSLGFILFVTILHIIGNVS